MWQVVLISVLPLVVRKDNSKGLVQTELQLSPWSSRTNLWFNLEKVNVELGAFFTAPGCVQIMSFRGFLVSSETGWEGLPKEGMEFPSLGVFKSHLHVILNNELWVALPEQGLVFQNSCGHSEHNFPRMG